MKTAALIVLILAVGGFWLYQFTAPRQTPPGQPPLVSLHADNFGDLARSFNEASDRVRVLVMLSPT